MKRSVLLNLLVAGLILTVGGLGCKRPQKGVTPIPAAKGGQVAGPTRTGPVTGPGTGGQGGLGSGAAVPTGGGTQSTPITSTPIEPTSPSGFAQPGLEEIEGMLADTNHFATQTVYFEFDSSVVRTSQHGRVNAVGDELKARPEAKLMLDGHCDERGTSEYNRSLGERRALAVREHLIRYGVSPDRMFTRSWGEDRPADLEHNEDAWSKNRRTEFILLTPKP